MYDIRRLNSSQDTADSSGNTTAGSRIDDQKAVAS